MKTVEEITPPGDSGGAHFICKPLLDVATERLFSTNAFRVLALPVDASVREISKHGDKLKQMEQLGMGLHGISKAFPLNPVPPFDQLREAIQRLRDPEKRLIDEFFWFWPEQFGQSGSDPAMQALAAGDSRTAIEIWNAKEADAASGVSTHNLAVLWHMTALEIELATFNSRVDSSQTKETDVHWTNAFGRWQRIVMDDKFWEKLSDRVRQIDDRRITPGFTHRMRQSLPEALFKINGMIALKYAEAGRTEAAKAHAGYVQRAGQSWANAERTAGLVLAPLTSRIKQQMSLARQRSTADPIQGAALASELATISAESTGAFDLIYGPGSRFPRELFDEVADTCNKMAVAYVNKTLDEAAGLAALKITLPLAALASLKKQIETNVSALEARLAAKKPPTQRPAASQAHTNFQPPPKQPPQPPPKPRMPASEQQKDSAERTVAAVLNKHFGDLSVKALVGRLNAIQTSKDLPQSKFATAATLLSKLERALAEISTDADGFWDLNTAGVKLLRIISSEAIRAKNAEIACNANSWAFRFAKTPELWQMLEEDKRALPKIGDSKPISAKPKIVIQNVISGAVVVVFMCVVIRHAIQTPQLELPQMNPPAVNPSISFGQLVSLPSGNPYGNRNVPPAVAPDSPLTNPVDMHQVYAISASNLSLLRADQDELHKRLVRIRAMEANLSQVRDPLIYNDQVEHINQEYSGYNELVTNYNAKLKALAVKKIPGENENQPTH